MVEVHRDGINSSAMPVPAAIAINRLALSPVAEGITADYPAMNMTQDLLQPPGIHKGLPCLTASRQAAERF